MAKTTDRTTVDGVTYMYQDAAAQEDLAALKPAMTTAQEDITSLQGDMTKVKSELEDIVAGGNTAELAAGNNYVSFAIETGKQYFFTNAGNYPFQIRTQNTDISYDYIDDSPTIYSGMSWILSPTAAANRMFIYCNGGTGKIRYGEYNVVSLESKVMTNADNIKVLQEKTLEGKRFVNFTPYNNNVFVYYPMSANTDYIITNESNTGAMAFQTWTTGDLQGELIETLIGELKPGESKKVVPSKDATYLKGFVNSLDGGQFSIRLADTLEEVTAELWNHKNKYNFSERYSHLFVNYKIVPGRTYILTNESNTGPMAFWTYTQGSLDGEIVEVINGNLGPGKSAVFIPSLYAEWVRGYINSLDGGQFSIYDADTFEQRIIDLENNSQNEGYDYGLIAWGDSLTAGAGGTKSYPQVCAEALGINYLNCGVGGETANTISARQGGNNAVIPAGSINKAYDELTDIFGGTIAPLLQGSGNGSGDKLYINGIECSLSYDSTTEKWTISGYTGGETAVPLMGKFRGSSYMGNIVVIFVGQNGVHVDGQSDVTPLITIIKSMIAHIPHNRYIVMGLSSGTSAQRDYVDARYLVEFGNNFFPTRKMLVNYGLDLEGIVPTTQDEEDIAVGTVPDSLRVDNVHLNTAGYHALGMMLADKIRGMGFVD